jgi:hypothetical protein
VVQETDKIRDHIDAERGRLERDLNEIEHRVTKAVDWREWFDRAPVRMLGAAAAGGFVLSLLIRRSSDASRVSRYDEFDPSTNATRMRQLQSSSKTSSQMDRIVSTFDNSVAALLGVASRKIRDYIADVVPNFREEYSEVEATRTALQSDPTSRRERSQVPAD